MDKTVVTAHNQNTVTSTSLSRLEQKRGGLVEFSQDH